jgi:K+-sensing histidine kinase KdpD
MTTPDNADHPFWQTPARIGAIVVPLATCAILSTLRDSITAATAVLVLVLWIVAAAASGDRLAGILAAVSGGVWFDFFLTEPYLRFTITDPDDIEATALLVLIGLGVTEIALWGHRQQAKAARRSGYLEGVLRAARIVSEGDTPASTLVELVGPQIADVLGASSCRYIAGPIHDAARPRRCSHSWWPQGRRREVRASLRRIHRAAGASRAARDRSFPGDRHLESHLPIAGAAASGCTPGGSGRRGA